MLGVFPLCDVVVFLSFLEGGGMGVAVCRLCLCVFCLWLFSCWLLLSVCLLSYCSCFGGVYCVVGLGVVVVVVLLFALVLPLFILFEYCVVSWCWFDVCVFWCCCCYVLLVSRVCFVRGVVCVGVLLFLFLVVRGRLCCCVVVVVISWFVFVCVFVF